jgi:hypothetical protein
VHLVTVPETRTTGFGEASMASIQARQLPGGAGTSGVVESTVTVTAYPTIVPSSGVRQRMSMPMKPSTRPRTSKRSMALQIVGVSMARSAPICSDDRTFVMVQSSSSMAISTW